MIELRNILASHNLDTTGTRAILIARLKSYLETHPVQDSVQAGPKQKKRKIDPIPKEKKLALPKFSLIKSKASFSR